jgi:hypothetical protein
MGLQGRQPGHEVGSVGVIGEDAVPLRPSHHHVMEGIRGIQAGLSSTASGL